MSLFKLPSEQPSQRSYDHYNNFIFDTNTSIFHKMAYRIELFNMIKNVPGDIVECGVFKGSGMALWLKLLMMHTPHDCRKVMGFDFFSRKDCLQTMENDVDNENMEKVFSRCENLDDKNISIDGITQNLIQAGIPQHKFELIPGDLCTTSKKIASERPGLRISLLYMDVDVDKPTYDTLSALWDKVSIGGLVVFDEYAVHVWSESNAVDRFVKEHGLILYKTDVVSPTAYIIKGCSCGKI